jgi:serine/threonine protein kinase
MTYECPNERLKDFVTNIKLYFNQKDNHIIYNKRNSIKVVQFEGKKYVVKSFKTPHLLNQFVYRFFRDSKAKRSFNNSIILRKVEIHTPEPVGYIEFPTKFRFRESFYISELFDFDFEIRAVFSDKNFEDREHVLKKFIEHTYRLHQKNIHHIDYSPGNILVKKRGSFYQFSIIDVNRMEFVPFDDELRMQNLAKLSNDKEDNEFMARYYAQIAKLDETTLLSKLNIALKKQEKYLANKKRLKKIKGKA